MVICFKFPFYKDFYFHSLLKNVSLEVGFFSVFVVVAGGEGKVRIFLSVFFLVTGTSGVWFVVKRFPNVRYSIFPH